MACVPKLVLYVHIVNVRCSCLSTIVIKPAFIIVIIITGRLSSNLQKAIIKIPAHKRVAVDKYLRGAVKKFWALPI